MNIHSSHEWNRESEPPGFSPYWVERPSYPQGSLGLTSMGTVFWWLKVKSWGSSRANWIVFWGQDRWEHVFGEPSSEEFFNWQVVRMGSRGWGGCVPRRPVPCSPAALRAGPFWARGLENHCGPGCISLLSDGARVLPLEFYQWNRVKSWLRWTRGPARWYLLFGELFALPCQVGWTGSCVCLQRKTNLCFVERAYCSLVIAGGQLLRAPLAASAEGARVRMLISALHIQQRSSLRDCQKVNKSVQF